ncbi:hypothetical protein DFH08DRAFT_814849 [Mycena albidolilacea]|uniref:Uncharacterized protein n=1 Tax=Mycena albidolilacea TaxID=1033008 RepID=A0AAD6ZP00_9AGAR|nr:hypothetical protein DFH08DRAFT_814849 [Mycena albidolilacea]
MKVLASRALTKVNETNSLQMKGGGARLLLTVQCERPIVTQRGAVNHGATGCGQYRARGSRKGFERAVGDEKGDVRGGCKWWQSRPSSWTQNAARSRHESAELNLLHRWLVYAREMERANREKELGDGMRKGDGKNALALSEEAAVKPVLGAGDDE